MSLFLGVDGGGTKTEFLLIDESGTVLATRLEGSAYYLEIGVDGLQAMLVTGIRDMLAALSLSLTDITYAFLGLPAYGENVAMLWRLDRIVEEILPLQRYRCANDVACGWAGALGGQDGITVVAGTGSIAYGELGSQSARAGGWGELFSDEGSAFWIAREALSQFSRMSDGRMPRSCLHKLIREHFRVNTDLEVCAAIYGPPPLGRRDVAALSRLVTQAARTGDPMAMGIFERAAGELAALVHAVRDALGAPPDMLLPTSYCGGMLQSDGVLLPLFETALHASDRRYELEPPRLPPSAGAALYAAKLAGMPLSTQAIAQLARTHVSHAAGNER